jgi:hypothetical protein
MKTNVFRRDVSTSALLNTDDASLLAYKTKKERAEKIAEMEHDVNNIKNELLEIKSMLHQILTKV